MLVKVAYGAISIFPTEYIYMRKGSDVIYVICLKGQFAFA